jgi:plastocyanin
MTRRLTAALACALLAVGAMAAPASADEWVYASGPAGQSAGFVPPAFVIFEGDTATYRNIDIASHDVRSTEFGPDRPWCTQFPFNFQSGGCPLFTSRLIGLAGESPIYGIEDAPPGTHAFICTLHNNMDGILVVLERPA